MGIITKEQQIKFTIQSGSVYHILKANKGYTSEAEHYFIVLNNNPCTDSFIIMCWITKNPDQISMSRNRNFRDRYIILSSHDYDELKTESVINCHNYEKISLNEIISKYKNNQLRIKKPISLDIVKNIRHKLLDSRQIEKTVINMLAD